MSRALTMVLLLGALTFTAGLGRSAISDSDEAFYAEAGREMVQSGDWLTPRYNYEDRFQKPILFYWLVAAAYLAAGVSEAAARVWSALAGIALVYLAYRAGRRWYDESTGLLAGLITATHFGYAAIAHLSLPDLPLACFVTAAIYFGTVALDTRGPAWVATLAAGASVGLACLAKGPLGLALPALVLGAIAAVERRQASGWMTKAVTATLLAIAISAPWYGAMIVEHGTGYAQGFFIGDNLERFATSRFNEPRVLWFYLPILAGGMLPWSAFLPLWVPRIWRAWRGDSPVRRVDWRFVIWAVLPLAFFTISVGKQPRYILPVLPPLAVLLGRTIATRLEIARSHGAKDGLLRGCAVAAGLALIALGALFARAQAVLVPLDNAASFQLWIGLVMLSGVVATTVALRGRLNHISWALSVATTASLVAVQCGLLAPGSEDPVTQMAALVRQHRTGNEPVGTYRVMVRNLVFYTGVKQVDLYGDEKAAAFLKSPERVLCVIGSDDLDRLTRQSGVKVRQIASFPYVNTAALKIGILLDPDPQDVTSALLVTNDR